MTTGRKLAICAMIIAGAISYYAYLGAAGSWQYYLTVDECLTDIVSLTGTRLRVSGKVADGSLQIGADRQRAAFILQGMKGKLPVTCTGPLPDNLAENIDVVVEGRLESPGSLKGDKVLTRCASKYEAKRPSSVSQPKLPPKPETAS
ncbi:MAG TPA: cytochrome c maturation protein CcmE [Thermoguttaceae bacterium]